MHEIPSNVADLDRYAWEAICNWPKAAGYDPFHGGLNLADLSRCFLWDKVGRAIRKEPFRSIFFYDEGDGGTSKGRSPGNIGKRIGECITSKVLTFRGRRRLLRSGRTVFAPKLSSRILQAVTRELLKDGDLNVVTQTIGRDMRPGRNLLVIPYPEAQSVSGPIAIELADAALYGLSKQGIDLLKLDSDLFRQQVVDMEERLARERRYMELLEPSCVIVHADNHHPHQAYVELARVAGIPSIMVQHGLDCERYYLDDAYADHIAVWGNERKQRYIAHSKPRWREITVTGNPAYDNIDFAEGSDSKGEYWLWVTRPHTEEKCYAPSRKPNEGLQILQAMMDELRKSPKVRLVVKPHPWDYARLYDDIASSSDLTDRIIVTQRSLDELMPDAGIVFAEDSTAGLDAMLYGKPLVHLHFAESEPVMPFADYGAAVRVRSAEELAEAIQHWNAHRSMQVGQKAFINDFAGPVDGESTKRVADFIMAI